MIALRRPADQGGDRLKVCDGRDTSEATTGASVAAQTCASISMLGPFSMPSLETSRRRSAHPSVSRRRRTSHRFPPSDTQPRPADGARRPPPARPTRPRSGLRDARSPSGTTAGSPGRRYPGSPVRTRWPGPPERGVVADAADISTLMSRAPTTRRGDRGCFHVRTRRPGPRGTHSAPSRCHCIAASSGEPYEVPVPPLDEADGLPVGHIDGGRSSR